jgi:hypothetical protein
VTQSSATHPREKRQPQFCSLLAQAQGFDPAGRATPEDVYLVIELPLPWPYSIYDAGLLPAELLALLDRTWEAATERLQVVFIAPDETYSRPSHRRVLYLRRASSPAAQFDRQEYLIPEAALTALATALLEQPADLSRFAPYREQEAKGEGVRDLLVCTHGAVDAACGKFGYPTYRLLRNQFAEPELRVWRASHFGGHICAPTLLSFPDGRVWAFIGAEQAEPLARWTGDPHSLYGHYRGWALLDHPMAQVLEREVWMREGWGWFGCQATAEIVAQAECSAPADEDDEEGEEEEDLPWAEVAIRYVAPDGRRGVYCGRVEHYRQINTIGSTNSTEHYNYAQYRVTRLDHLPEHAAADPVTWLKELAA